MKIKTVIFEIFLVIFFLYNFTGSLYSQDDSKKDSEISDMSLEQKELLYVLNNASQDSEVLQQFGEPEEKSEFIYYGADDSEHQFWLYKSLGLKIDFVKDDSKTLFVSSVKINSPSNLKTSRGIGIRSTKDEVLNAYKDEINSEESKIYEGMIVAGSVYGGIIFDIKNGKVTSIFIGASAE
ncbi:MAG TPA: hypothetical protein VIL99_09520 [Ignavibacteria bacterium]